MSASNFEKKRQHGGSRPGEAVQAQGWGIATRERVSVSLERVCPMGPRGRDSNPRFKGRGGVGCSIGGVKMRSG